ncbi:MAG: class IV adenylate cyclase [Candidatus Geothermincolia bacterium]
MKNLEIKARIENLEAAVETATILAGSCHSDVRQVDTYFFVPTGRLKLREYGDTAELISYHRPDTREPKFSEYEIALISDPSGVKEALAAALGIKCVVTKRRRVFLTGNTRIHVDEVEDLGAFLEFEVVLGGSGDLEDPASTVARLSREFGITEEDLVDVSYCDLLESDGG